MENSSEITLEALQTLVVQQGIKIDELETKLSETGQENSVSLIVFSNDLDKALAAFIIAVGAASMGMHVNMFFTFWGTSVLRKETSDMAGKNIFSKMFDVMLPNGSKKIGLSQMHMMGAGTAMMKKMMNDQNITSLEDLIGMVTELEVNMQICEMSMGLMGMKHSEMVCQENSKICGVANYIEEASKSKITLFI